MEFIKVTLLVLSVISAGVCSIKERTANKKHFDLLKQFRCKDPQPRVFELEEVLPKDILIHKHKVKINPPVTILHRCNSSGCCEERDERCAPLASSEVTLTFAVFHRNFVQYLDVNATNHTQCACTTDYDTNIK